MKKMISVALVLIMVTILSFGCREKKEEPKDLKPVIYLYPERETEVEVKLTYKGNFICTYPKYEDGWQVTAYPDGKIINGIDGKEYSYLFWEGVSDYEWEITEGFVVEGKDTVEFLQDKLNYLGLTPEEYNEFIVYWLPRMESNNYNLIYFAEEDYENLAQLSVTPNPNNIIRIFMVYKALDESVDIDVQNLEAHKRDGFTVVEWGGTEIK